MLEITDKLKNIEYINGILLFGSIAKGRYNEYSDIDILVIINNNISGHDCKGIISSFLKEEKDFIWSNECTLSGEQKEALKNIYDL